MGAVVDHTVSFGYWIRRQRKALDLTQEALARRVGCATVTIRKIERDERRPSHLMAERLADALGVPKSERRQFLQVALAERSPAGLALVTGYQDRPPESASSFVYNLPLPPTLLVGRKRESVEAIRLLKSRDVRLLSLVGPPGVGKTRLAIRVAERIARHFRNGVVFVPLGSVIDPDMICAKIAESVGLAEARDQSLVKTLAEHLQKHQMLLLLDNFEHLISEAGLVSKFLASAPGLKVLVTSRAALNLSWEHEYAVYPLQVPALVYNPHTLSPVPTDSLSTLESNESFQLFTNRARARRQDFAVNCHTAPYVAEICRRLDGLPLAIELAAARVRTESPQTLLARLASRLEVLTDGPLDVPMRMQTLRSAFDWSYELLEEQERYLFSRLGVFRGGFSKDAALAVCCYEPLDWSESRLVEGLSTLVDQSMLQRTEDPGREPHYAMLETVREYALEELARTREEDVTRRRHLEFFADLAEAAEPHLWSEEQETWGGYLEIELDNLRAAMNWALDRRDSERDEIEMAARLAGALWFFWYGRGYLHEGRRWLTRALARASWPSKARAKALAAAGALAWQQGDNARGRLLADESLDLWRRLEDLPGLAEILHLMGHMIFDQQDYETAHHLFQESLQIYEATEDTTVRISLIGDLGMVAYHQEDYRGARKRYEQSLALFQERGIKDGVAQSYLRLGDLARLADDYEQAFNLYLRGRELFEELNQRLDVASANHKLGYVYQERGEIGRAREAFLRALELQAEIGNKQGLIECLAGLAGLATSSSHLQLAALLFGAATGLADATGLPVAPADQAVWDRYESLAKEQLGAAEYQEIWREGFTQPSRQAVEEARRGNYLP